MNDQISLIPLGGVGDVTKNMYVYEYQNQVLIVDCGLGFPDETMVGVDLLLPDISYLLAGKKQIVGMLITHGHEDHFGGLPFVLPQLPTFPIFATPLTASLANSKLKEFGIDRQVKSIDFGSGEINIGPFKAEFIHVTHSVPDTSHIAITTPVGIMYHGSDYKFDPHPLDGKPSDLAAIEAVGKKGVLCLLSDCLGAEKIGHVKPEDVLIPVFDEEMKNTKGKFIFTTYASNIARLNKIIEIGYKHKKKLCFIGRSLVKNREVGTALGYMTIPSGMEVELDDLGTYRDSDLLLIVAGTQGQASSAMTRIVHGEHRNVKLSPDDVVIFSSDPIPGNEVSVYSLIDELAKEGVRVLYSDILETVHVSGHGARDELKELIELTKPQNLIPIGGAFRHMAAYKELAIGMGIEGKRVFLLENGQELLISEVGIKFGRKIGIRNVYVDEISGEELEGYVLRDRQRLVEGGIVIVLAELDSQNYTFISKPDVIIRGFSGVDTKRLSDQIYRELKKRMQTEKKGIANWGYLRKIVGQTTERAIFKMMRRRPLVLPVVVEV